MPGNVWIVLDSTSICCCAATLVVDDHGYPVDGDFLAGVDTDGDYVAAFPTGDGIAGGLFEKLDPRCSQRNSRKKRRI